MPGVGSRWRRGAVLALLVIAAACARGLGPAGFTADAASPDASAARADGPPADLAANDSVTPADGPPGHDAPPADGEPTADAPPADAESDASPADAAVNACTAAATLPNNDTFASAIDLSAGAAAPGGVTTYGDTSGYADDARPSCGTGFSFDGADAFYQVSATAGQSIRVDVTPVAWDVAAYILQECTSAAACVVGVDAELAGRTETLSHTFSTSGTYCIVVDGYNPGKEGCYTLHVELM